jgi:hypothetical protein
MDIFSYAWVYPDVAFFGFRLAEKNNFSILLVFASLYGVASTGTYPN